MKKVGKEKGGVVKIYHINSIFQNLLRHKMKKEKIIAIVYDKDGAFDGGFKRVVSPLQSFAVQQIRFPLSSSCMVVAHDGDLHPASSLV